ncbi:hypothetical protein BXA20_12300 [Corynebacterium diphtheriae]|nr:hypothetical protein BXA20_12300 [Corynebacterium diphtheriae]
MFSATMRSSTRRTTRSLASWSNFLGMFQIFPSTQTEQNLGHFTISLLTKHQLSITTVCFCSTYPHSIVPTYTIKPYILLT